MLSAIKLISLRFPKKEFLIHETTTGFRNVELSFGISQTIILNIKHRTHAAENPIGAQPKMILLFLS